MKCLYCGAGIHKNEEKCSFCGSPNDFFAPETKEKNPAVSINYINLKACRDELLKRKSRNIFFYIASAVFFAVFIVFMSLHDTYGGEIFIAIGSISMIVFIVLLIIGIFRTVTYAARIKLIERKLAKSDS